MFEAGEGLSLCWGAKGTAGEALGAGGVALQEHNRPSADLLQEHGPQSYNQDYLNSESNR